MAQEIERSYSEEVFALDIGTRKVMGILSRRSAKGWRIVAAERMEHPTRSMYDGQIHHVAEVAEVVRQVKSRIESKTGARLSQASVAAAGRALRTYRGRAVRENQNLNELTDADVMTLELEAVQDAQRRLTAEIRNVNDDAAEAEYHYVGHTVLSSELDGKPISQLRGHLARTAFLEVIATFLPREVVDSLLSVLERADLEVNSLTLEPIAAISAVVPATMRHLNLALVDIGAGTSDIAVTSRGAVVAYDMLPVAGDEITERISHQYLLDFAVAESVKRSLGKKEIVKFTDVLGNRHSVFGTEIVDWLAPTVEEFAGRLAERILSLNGDPPSAVVLVGGGSQTPLLTGLLAKDLGLPENRVAVRGREAISGFVGGGAALQGPDSVTGLGIVATARDQAALGFVFVTVGGRRVRLFHPSRRLNVGDALLTAGVSLEELRGGVGKGLTVIVNGQLRLVRGTIGRPAQVLVNGQSAGLDAEIKPRDEITFVPGARGEPGRARLADMAGELGSIRVTVNGQAHQVEAVISVNGRLVEDLSAELADNDKVEIRSRAPLSQLLPELGPGLRPSCLVVCNGQSVDFETVPAVRLNGQAVGLDCYLHPGDEIVWLADGTGPTIADLLLRIGLAPSPPPGRRSLVLERNGRPAAFTDTLTHGDRVRVDWE